MGCCLQTPDKSSMSKFSLKVGGKKLYIQTDLLSTVTANILIMLILILRNNALWKWAIFLTFHRNLLPPFLRHKCKSCTKITYAIHMERR